MSLANSGSSEMFSPRTVYLVLMIVQSVQRLMMMWVVNALSNARATNIVMMSSHVKSAQKAAPLVRAKASA
jgi:hypothetical protein